MHSACHRGSHPSKLDVIPFFYCILGLGVHVKNMQDCCIGTHMAVWFAAFLPFTYIWHFSPCYLSPTPHPLLCLPYFPPTDPSVWCFPPCVQVFSLFNTHLWVRTCGVWFSVLVSVCWEWCSPGSSMSLQGTQTHHFWWLHNIPWCIRATFSLSSLSSMGIWLVPGLCYCKQCHNKHSCVCVLIVEWFIILWIYTQ